MLQLQNSVSVMRRELQNLRRQVNDLRRALSKDVLAVRASLTGTSTEVRLGGSSSQPRSTRISSSPSAITTSAAATLKFEAVGAAEHKLKMKRGSRDAANVITQPEVVSHLSSLAIGRIRTCFQEKNGTPRQAGLCAGAIGSIQIDTFNNPNHSLQGLEEFSHLWLLFVFHKNNQKSVKAKVKPPRLGGVRRGVFATRSPHRPCPIGLSLVRLERVEGGTVHVSGVDLLDGTPVLDIKPYIPDYDAPRGSLILNKEIGTGRGGGGDRVEGREWREGVEEKRGGGGEEEVRVASWLHSPPASELEVIFSEEAERQLSLFHCQQMQPEAVTAVADSTQVSTKQLIDTTDDTTVQSAYTFVSFPSLEVARQAIVDMLRQDPRSVYRKTKCSEDVYKVSIDNLNLTCRFSGTVVSVTDIQPKVFWTKTVNRQGAENIG